MGHNISLDFRRHGRFDAVGIRVDIFAHDAAVIYDAHGTVSGPDVADIVYGGLYVTDIVRNGAVFGRFHCAGFQSLVPAFGCLDNQVFVGLDVAHVNPDLFRAAVFFVGNDILEV